MSVAGASWAACLSAAAALALYAGEGQLPFAAPAPTPTPTPAATGASLPVVPVAAIPRHAPPVQRLGGKLDLRWVAADRRLAIAQLAAASGSSLFGADGLPPALGSVTLNADGLDTATAWHLLLDNAPLGFALVCDARVCEVWFAPASAAPTTSPVTAQALRTVSTEADN